MNHGGRTGSDVSGPLEPSQESEATGSAANELSRKRRELAALRETLAELESEWAALEVRLARFEQRYVTVVGRRYVELDALLAEIATLRAKGTAPDSAANARAEKAREQARKSADALGDVQDEPQRPSPDPALRALFREAAKEMHPDLAVDDADRLRRDEFMREANLAYQNADRERLEELLREWRATPQAVRGGGMGAELARVIRQLQQVEKRIAELEERIEEAERSPRAKLMEDSRRAEAEGRDLLEEMAREVDMRVADARSTLERLREDSP